jgi:hypothetical protein
MCGVWLEDWRTGRFEVIGDDIFYTYALEMYLIDDEEISSDIFGL